MNKKIFLFFLMILTFPFVVYFENMGGQGFNLPMNSVFIGVSFVILTLSFMVIFFRRTMRWSIFSIQIIAAAIIAAIPLAYTSEIFLTSAVWRVFALIVASICYFAMLQFPLENYKNQYSILLGAGFIVFTQAVIVLIQYFYPNLSWIPYTGGRPYGIFQQVNVLGSFIATGLVLTLVLFMLPAYRLPIPGYEIIRQMVLSFLLILLPALLIWIQSRAGWLGGALGVVLCFGLLRRYGKPGYFNSLILISTGVLWGIITLFYGNETTIKYVSHEGSNIARLTMLRDTLKMLKEYPVVGWGYGAFEYSFQNFRVHQAVPTLVTEIARHPHNEILLWWVEGGALGIFTMLFFVYAIFRLWVQVRRYEQRALLRNDKYAGRAIGLFIMTIPIAIHTQFELPFYLSAAHAMIFLLLLAITDCSSAGIRVWRPACRITAPMIRMVFIVMFLCIIVLMLSIFCGERKLYNFEIHGLKNVNELEKLSAMEKWSHFERWQYDFHVSQLLIYNDYNDNGILSQYVAWATDYLSCRVDDNVYANLISILHYQQKTKLEVQYRTEAALLFPEDPRFR